MTEPTFDLRQLRQLRQFAVLAEECHFGRAAARLAMTQPPLTQAIQRLEAALGARLFERSQRRVALSPAGAALLPLARKLLDGADALAPAVRAAAAGLSGQLRLAFVSSVTYGPLPAWLSGFRAAYPDVALSLREATLDVQLELFAAGEIDAGFVLHAPGAVPPGFEHVRVIDEALVMALPQGHAAWRSAPASSAAMPRLRWRDVRAEPLVIFPRQIAPSLFDELVSAYHAGGATMRVAQQAIQMQTIVNLVSGGMGVAWVPESLTHLQRAGVRYARVSGLPGQALRCETSLVWRAGAAPVVERFVEHVRGAPRRVSQAR
ncbi:MAG TPA: LysR family transcriptional regulator [Burkholderiaceae bacterium]|nr:LysR family transcriptional regulator [Burkholderiaceae bacterium]